MLYCINVYRLKASPWPINYALDGPGCITARNVPPQPATTMDIGVHVGVVHRGLTRPMNGTMQNSLLLQVRCTLIQDVGGGVVANVASV